MVQKIYILLLLSFVYNTKEINCNFSAIPSQQVVTDHDLSYVSLKIEYLNLSAKVLIPKSYKMIPENSGLTQSEYLQNQTINTIEEKSLPKLNQFQKRQQQQYVYTNSYIFRETDSISQGLSENQQIISLQVLVFGNDDAIKFIDVFYLNQENQHNCQYGLELNTVLSASQNYFLKFLKINKNQLTLIIYQNMKSFYQNQIQIQVLKIQPEETQTKMNVYRFQQDLIISLVKEEYLSKEIFNFNDVLTRKFDYKGNKIEDYSFNVDGEQNLKDYIPNAILSKKIFYYNYEFINQNNVLKFYQLEVQESIGVKYKTIGFYLNLDPQKIQVYVIKDLQQYQQTFYYTEQNHGILGFNELEKIKVTYQFFQDNFATIDKYEFNPQIQNDQIIDSHLLFHEHSLQSDDQNGQIDYQLLVAYKYDNKELEIQVYLGQQEIVNRKKKWLRQRQNYQINQQKFSQVQQNNQNQIDYEQNRKQYQFNYHYDQLLNFVSNTDLVQSLQEQILQVQQQSDSNISQQKPENLKLEKLSKDDQSDMEEDLNFSLDFDKYKVEFLIKNFENKIPNLKCDVSSVYEPQTFNNMQAKNFSVSISAKKVLKLKAKFIEQTDQIVNFDIGIIDFDLIIQENNLLNKFCYAIIKENVVILQFSDLQNGFIFQEKLYFQQQQNQLTIRQHIFILEESKLKQNKFDSKDLFQINFNSFNQYQYLILEKGKYTNIDSESYRFLDLKTSSQKSMEQPFNQLNDLRDQITFNLHTFFLQKDSEQIVLITKLGLYIQPQNHQAIYLLQTDMQLGLIFQYNFLNTQSYIGKQIYLHDMRYSKFSIVKQQQEIETYQNLSPLTVLYRSQNTQLTFNLGKSLNQNYYIYIYDNNIEQQTYILNIYYERQIQTSFFSCMSTQTYEDPNSFYVQLVQIDRLQQPPIPFQQFRNDENSNKILMKTNNKNINENLINLVIGYNETSNKNNPQEFYNILNLNLNFEYLNEFYTYIIDIPNLNLQKLKTIVNQISKEKDNRQRLQGKLIFKAFKKLVMLV